MILYSIVMSADPRGHCKARLQFVFCFRTVWTVRICIILSHPTYLFRVGVNKNICVCISPQKADRSLFFSRVCRADWSLAVSAP